MKACPHGIERCEACEEALRSVLAQAEAALVPLQEEIARLRERMTDVAIESHGAGQESAAADVARLQTEATRLAEEKETLRRALEACRNQSGCWCSHEWLHLPDLMSCGQHSPTCLAARDALAKVRP